MKNTELVLAINEPFGSVSCNFYRTGDTGDIWMTREQIGMALEYSDPRDAIKKMHQNHRERLDKYSIMVPIEKGVGVSGIPYPINTGGEKETYLYSNKGIMEICRWSKQPKADQFIDFVWDVMDKLIKGDLALLPTSTASTTDLIRINQQMADIGKYLTGVNEKLAAMEQEQRVIKSQPLTSPNLYGVTQRTQ